MEIGEDERVEVPLLRDEYSRGGYQDKWVTTGSGGGMSGDKTEPTLEAGIKSVYIIRSLSFSLSLSHTHTHTHTHTHVFDV